MIQERVARRYIAALRTASFIPDKFWKEKKAKLRTILTKTTKDNGPDDYSLAITWELIPFLHNTKHELSHFGLNEYAEKTIEGYVEGLVGYLKTVAEKLDQFHAACVADPSAPHARDKVVWLIRWKALGTKGWSKPRGLITQGPMWW